MAEKTWRSLPENFNLTGRNKFCRFRRFRVFRHESSRGSLHDETSRERRGSLFCKEKNVKTDRNLLKNGQNSCRLRGTIWKRLQRLGNRLWVIGNR